MKAINEYFVMVVFTLLLNIVKSCVVKMSSSCSKGGQFTKAWKLAHNAKPLCRHNPLTHSSISFGITNKIYSTASKGKQTFNSHFQGCKEDYI